MLPQVQIPDFAGTILRGEMAQANRLAMLAQQRQVQESQRFADTLAEVAPQLGTASGDQRMSILARLAGAGPQGAQMAIPLLQREREQAEFGRLLSGAMGDASPSGSPPAAPAASPGMPAPPAIPVDGPTDPRERAREADRRRQAIMDNPNLTPEQQAAELARVSAWLAAPSVPERPGGYRANPGSEEAGRPFAGLPAPSGVVRPVVPGAASPAAPTGAPAAAPATGTGLPSPQALFAMAASGNPRAVEFVRTVAPLVARENPNFVLAEIGGRRVAVNPQNPNQRVDLGAATAPNWAEQTVLQLGPLVASGRASPAQQQEYAVAATSWQTSSQQLAEIPDPSNPGGTLRVAVPRPLPPGFPAPPALPTAPAPQQPVAAPQQGQPAPQRQAAPGGVSIPGTPLQAEPPAPTDPNASRVIGRASGTLTEAQARANLFGGQMQQGMDILGRVQTPSNAAILAWRHLPESGVNMALSENDQQYFNALRLFAAGVLRKETGAAFTTQELLDVQSRFFPMPGDSPQALRQKETARRQAVESIRAEMPGGQFRGIVQDGGAAPAAPADPLGILGGRAR